MRFELFFILLFACAPWIPESLPVTVEIDLNMPILFIDNAQAGFTTWNGLSDRKVFRVEVKKLSKDECGKIQVTTRAYDLNKRLGRTESSECGAVIYLAEQLQADRITQVTEHEAGHAIGLTHSPDPTSIMYPDSAVYRRNVRLCSILVRAAHSSKTCDVACETLQHVEIALIDPLRELIKECSTFGRDQSVVGDKIAAILDEFNKGEFEE